MMNENKPYIERKRIGKMWYYGLFDENDRRITGRGFEHESSANVMLAIYNVLTEDGQTCNVNELDFLTQATLRLIGSKDAW